MTTFPPFHLASIRMKSRKVKRTKFCKSSHYCFLCYTGVAIGTVVRDFNAIDLDTPDTLIYSILTDNNNYTINSTSGELIVDMPLDREYREVESLQIQVTDGTNNVRYLKKYYYCASISVVHCRQPLQCRSHC